MINWKLRLQNKTTLISLSTVIIAFVYQILGIIGVVPKVSEDEITQLVLLLINVLASIGIVVDPTTSGMGDSSTALTRKNINESK